LNGDRTLEGPRWLLGGRKLRAIAGHRRRADARSSVGYGSGIANENSRRFRRRFRRRWPVLRRKGVRTLFCVRQQISKARAVLAAAPSAADQVEARHQISEALDSLDKTLAAP
jgi:hypothetical protein